MTISVCVGSSCHLKGSYNIVELLKAAVKANGMDDDVLINGTFCLGKCTDGVTIKVDDEIITGVSPDNFDEIFNKYVLKK